MRDEGVFKEQVVATSRISRDPIVCPGCGADDLLLYGYVLLERRERIEKGVPLAEEWPNFPKDGAFTFEVHKIDCFSCCSRFYLKPDDELAKDEIILRLQEELAVVKSGHSQAN
jgi:hypothetical protein